MKKLKAVGAGGLFYVLIAVSLSVCPNPSWAAEGGPHLDGGELGLAWAIPFAGILLSIALCPLVFPHFWHRHFGKVSAFWALAFLVPFTINYGPGMAVYEVLHTLMSEYVPFIILLLALYTVAGGVRMKGSLVGTPTLNTAFLAIGTLIASLMGTTGAAMLLIRPLIRANEHRKAKTHILVFFIFLVANIGGSLSPLGDPPLFLGFLKGVDFFWPTVHLLPPMLLCSGILLVLFFVFDTVMYRRETEDVRNMKLEYEPLGIEGKVNLLLLLCVVCAVLMSGILQLGHFTVYYVEIAYQNILRDVLLLLIAWLSWRLTSWENRKANAFSWFPIVEVGKLFAGIFLTIVPAIAILKAGTSGALGGVVAAVSHDGAPVYSMYFWLTGALSSFLDNAPTYLVFFNAAGGDAQTLMAEGTTLMAISAGAVFMGANTYIGNAPNFMVRSIAEERGVPMPSFFGYMAWSGAILLPLFALVTVIFFI